MISIQGLAAATGLSAGEFRPIGGGHGARHYRATLADGRDLFIKSIADPSAGDAGARLAAEAAGLRWLAEAGAAPVPEIIFSGNALLALVWLPQASPDRAAAERFGRELAALHAFGADSFGAPWRGFIASLDLSNDSADSWAPWYAEHRLLPYCRIAVNAGTLGRAESKLIESVADRIADLAGPAEPPSRIHGDCWSGNVLWSGGRGWLIDPAAHGGHRETDLAMLDLFGLAHLDRVLAAYSEVAPLADGWRSRIPLHQLHPLLVHVCLFGSGYVDSTVAAARAALALC
ncbi:MAG TPA: fructosamine kinase family protein [Streptosporangiaceae bacterium]|nr:fructosamine kinase family protein [Streptosporangiaceae bacterium]